MVMLLAALLLTGCASGVQRFNYGRYEHDAPIKRIIIAGPNQVDEHCRKYGKSADDGSSLDGKIIHCCWEPGRRAMLVADDSLDCMAHEICHVAKIDSKECDKYHAQR